MSTFAQPLLAVRHIHTNSLGRAASLVYMNQDKYTRCHDLRCVGLRMPTTDLPGGRVEVGVEKRRHPVPGRFAITIT